MGFSRLQAGRISKIYSESELHIIHSILLAVFSPQMMRFSFGYDTQLSFHFALQKSYLELRIAKNWQRGILVAPEYVR